MAHLPFLPNLCISYYFSVLMSCAGSQFCVNYSGDSRHPCLDTHLKGNKTKMSLNCDDFCRYIANTLSCCFFLRKCLSLSSFAKNFLS